MEDLKKYINTLRKDFSLEQLNESIVDKDPILQFTKWFKEAIDAQLPEPNAMVLSTANAMGKPSARVLLLRGFDANGFVFYTNYNSRKGKEISQNPMAAMTFFWQALERQVRIEGILEKQKPEESDVYFKGRPRESKLGAWVSEQSAVVKSRAEIEIKLEDLSKKYPGHDVPRPIFWGGYSLKPECIEFWQGRPGRLHDRIVYTLKEAKWEIVRLAP